MSLTSTVNQQQRLAPPSIMTEAIALSNRCKEQYVLLSATSDQGYNVHGLLEWSRTDPNTYHKSQKKYNKQFIRMSTDQLRYLGI